MEINQAHLETTDGAPPSQPDQSVFIQFADTNGDETGTPIYVSCKSDVSALSEIVTSLREKVSN